MKMETRGLTLVEILAAMAVMVIGLAAITMMLLTGTKFSRQALERNAAAMIVAEAVPEIERRHLITGQMLLKDGTTFFTPPQEHIGLFIETTNNTVPLGASTCPDIHDPSYTDVRIGASGFHGEALELKCFAVPPSAALSADQIHMSMWPMPPSELPKSYGALQVLRPSDTSPHGTPLRVLYRLERHPEWHEHSIDPATGASDYNGVVFENSIYRGVYVLTMTIYRDGKRDGSILEQVSDPYVVYLNDKKVRE